MIKMIFSIVVDRTSHGFYHFFITSAVSKLVLSSEIA